VSTPAATASTDGFPSPGTSGDGRDRLVSPDASQQSDESSLQAIRTSKGSGEPSSETVRSTSRGAAVGDALAAFPDFALSAETETGAAFVALGVGRFHDAVRYVWRLPYGRNADREDWWLVLPEGRGTCSTKHALLAQLAREHGISVELVLGIFEMREANTPGVGAVLDAAGLDALPEAHCYLRIGDTRLDVTRDDAAAAEPIDRFLSEKTIEPAEIGERKLAIHRAAMEAWVRERLPGWTVDDAWRVREGCIGALTRRADTRHPPPQVGEGTGLTG
jgi:hypothetical protein